MIAAVLAGAAVPGRWGAATAAPRQSSAAATIEVSGFGYGHGRGMGQWGAFGYATEYGWGYKQILAHYYGGTTLGTLASPEPDITVQLLELDGHNTIAAALGGGELVASWLGGAPIAGSALEVARSGANLVVLRSSGCAGPWRQVASTTEAVTIASAQPGAGIPEAAGIAASEVQACIPGIGARTYQGELVSQPGGQTQNVLPLEDYVDGVVPAETPVSWASTGGEAALEAQAVAARSFAVATLASGGVVCDSTACQMYTGLPDQFGLTADAAVLATAGQVLYCAAGSGCGPAGSVALTEYSASTGGYTAGGAFPAVPDLGDSVAANPVHTWTADIPISDVESTFGSIGALQAIDVTQRNGLGQIGGRVEQMSVVGDLGTVDLTGATFAADFSLRSDWFQIVAPGAVPPLVSLTTTTTTATTVTATTTTSPPPGNETTTTIAPPAGFTPPGGGVHLGPVEGYWVASSEGVVAAFGAATSYGGAIGTTLQGSVTAMAATPDGKGYWLAGRDGGVLAFGDAEWYGSASHLHLARRIIAIASTPDGRGYWLVSRDGGVFAYGNAVFYGSTGNLHLGRMIIGMAPTPDGRGYWLVTGDGRIFAFGDARFYGSLGHVHLNGPVTAIVPSADGRGYFLVARDGGVFAFGDATFVGSLPGKRIRARVVAVAPVDDNSGYYVLTASGRVYAFGHASLRARLGPARATTWGRAVAIVCYRPRG